MLPLSRYTPLDRPMTDHTGVSSPNTLTTAMLHGILPGNVRTLDILINPVCVGGGSSSSEEEIIHLAHERFNWEKLPVVVSLTQTRRDRFHCLRKTLFAIE